MYDGTSQSEGDRNVWYVGRFGKSLFVTGSGLFIVAFISGAVQSWRLERRLPMIDLIVSGPEDHIDDLVTRQDYDRAIKQLTMQVRLQPDNAAAREHLGNLLGTQMRLEEAQVQFQELVRLRPDYAEGYGYLGSAYLDSGHPFLATNSFKRAIELKPDFSVAHNNLGVALARRGQLADAEKSFAKAVELSPDYKEARINLSQARKSLQGHP